MSLCWPAATYKAYNQSADLVERQSWYGSLIEEKSDDSGLMYMRNRYYNPATGSFTQEDPIGVAGGLNTYGFANGDPATFSDPFGLRASGGCPPDCDAEDGGWALLGASLGGFLGGGGGAALGLSCGPAAPVCSTAGGAKGTMIGAGVGVAISNGIKSLGNVFARDGDEGGGGDGGESQGSSAGRMQREVERGQAPRSIKRVDRGRAYREQDNVHFKDGNHALNRDGTWKHGGRDLTKAESEWLTSHGWGT